MGLFNDSLTTRRDNSMTDFRRDMRDFFDRFNRDFSSDGLTPKVEVEEKGNQYCISAEIPGMSEKDLNVTLKENHLILEGERKNERKEEKDGYFETEFSYGKFYRAIPLQHDVDPETIVANYRDGILRVELTKLATESSKERKIEINRKVS